MKVYIVCDEINNKILKIKRGNVLNTKWSKVSKRCPKWSGIRVLESTVLAIRAAERLGISRL